MQDGSDSHNDHATNPASPSHSGQRQAPPAADQAAINSVPVRDYSDYEITIESKDEYRDALFANDDELEQALTESRQQPATTSTAKPAVEPEPATTDGEQPVDYARFLGQPPDQAITPSDKLSIINNSLNNSPARKQLPPSEHAPAFMQQLAAITAQLEQQQREQHTAAAPEPPVSHAEQPATGHGKLSAFAGLIKTTSQQLSSFGKAKLVQSKGELDEYLGRTLPEREFSLDFILPTANPKAEPKTLLPVADVEKLLTLKGKPLASILRKVSEELSALAKTPLSVNKRLALLNSYRPHVGEKIQSVIAMYQRKPVAFDDEKRSHLAGHALNSIKQLITGYKQIYSELYYASNLHYRHQRDTANSTAFTLVDCLLLEQRLAIALHTQPATGSAKTLNKLFYALSRYEPQLLDESAYSMIEESEVSINHLYSRYHLNSVVDFKGLSSTLHKTAHLYISDLLSQLSLIPLSVSSRLDDHKPGQQLLCIDHHADEPTTLLGQTDHSRSFSEAPDTVYIVVQAVFNQIKHDYVEALKRRINQRPGHSAAALSHTPPVENLQILAALNKSIRDLETHQSLPTFTLYQPVQLKAYSGLSDCCDYLQYHFVKKHRSSSPKEAAAELPTLPAGSKSPWFSAVEDGDFLHLETTEFKLGISLDIGQLVLFVQQNDAKPAEDANAAAPALALEQVHLTRIIRLERQAKGKLQLTAQQLAAELTQATLTTTAIPASPCLIIIRGQQRSLITSASLKLCSGQPLHLECPDLSTSTAVIAGLSAVSGDYQLLTLH